MGTNQSEDFDADIEAAEENLLQAENNGEEEDISEPPPEILDAGEIDAALKKFRERYPKNWERRLQWTDTKLGNHTVAEISTAFREDRVINWKRFVKRGETYIPPSRLTNFIHSWKFRPAIRDLFTRTNKIKILTIDLIIEAALEKYQSSKPPRWPTKEDKAVEHGTLGFYNITWAAINIALREKLHGLTDCPYNSLHELLVGEQLIEEKMELSVCAIRVSAFATWLKSLTSECPKGHWPSEKDGLIECGPLADGVTTWSGVSLAIARKHRGLTDENCAYESLQDLLIQEGLLQKKATLSVENIVLSARLTFANSITARCPKGRWPSHSDGLIEYGPLADGITTWEQVNQNITKKFRGLTSENCPYKSLRNLFVSEGLKKPYHAPKSSAPKEPILAIA